jgi:hypothetical protein
MSRTYRKFNYVAPGSYGATDKKHILVCIDHGCDVITIFDEKGEVIVSCEDWSDDVLPDFAGAISKALMYEDGDEEPTIEEINKMGYA